MEFVLFSALSTDHDQLEKLKNYLNQALKK